MKATPIPEGRRDQPLPRLDSSVTRIFLVDDHPIVRKGMTELINQQPDMAVCGEASSVEEARRLLPEVKPDLVIIDIGLQGASGMELLNYLKNHEPDLLTLVLSMHDEALYAERALRAGARGYVMKHEATTRLQAAIRRVLKGRIYLSERMTDRMLERATHGDGDYEATPLEKLSDRELEVFQLIGQGLRTSEIADSLCLSVKTIETHRAHIKEKLRLTSAAELVKHAVAWAEGC